MRLMAAGEWYGKASHFKLSDEWGIETATVKSDAAEAHRRLLSDPEEQEADRLALAQFCARMRAKAEAERSMVTGLADIGSALKAAELEAKFKGIDIDEAPGGALQPVALRVVVVEEPEAPEAADPPPVPPAAK